MIGLYFCKINNNTYPQIRILNKNFSEFSRKINENYFLGLIQPSELISHNVFYKDENNFLLFDGFVFFENKRVKAEKLFYLLRDDVNTIKNLNGEFFIAYNYMGEKTFISDRMGTRQHYFYKHINDYTIAPDILWIINNNNLNREINENALITFIAFNKLRYLDETIWNNIKVFPSGTRVKYEINNNNIRVEKYWEYLYLRNKKVDIDELVSIYKNAVNLRHLSEFKGAISLSGGLDSRSIISALNSYDNIEATTVGIKDSDEVLIAKEIAKQENISFYFYELTPTSFLDNINISLFYQEDIDILTQLMWHPFLQNIADSEYLIHGLDLDVTLGGIYLDAEFLSKDFSGKDFLDFVLKKSLSTKRKLLQELFKKEINLDEFLNLFFDDGPNSVNCNNYLEMYDTFIQKYSMGRVIVKRYADIRRLINTITPMYDNDLLEFLYAIPIEERINYKLFHPWYKKLDSRLFSKKYQRTGLPGIAPVKYWKAAQKLQSDQEELYRKIAHETKGKIYIPFKKYYTNLDEWLRFEPRWINLTNKLLLSDDTIISEKYINQKVLREVIQDHQNHKRSYMKIIVILLSAELYLRVASGSSRDDLNKLFLSGN